MRENGGSGVREGKGITELLTVDAISQRVSS